MSYYRDSDNDLKWPKARLIFLVQREDIKDSTLLNKAIKYIRHSGYSKVRFGEPYEVITDSSWLLKTPFFPRSGWAFKDGAFVFSLDHLYKETETYFIHYGETVHFECDVEVDFRQYCHMSCDITWAPMPEADDTVTLSQALDTLADDSTFATLDPKRSFVQVCIGTDSLMPVCEYKEYNPASFAASFAADVEKDKQIFDGVNRILVRVFTHHTVIYEGGSAYNDGLTDEYYRTYDEIELNDKRWEFNIKQS